MEPTRERGLGVDLGEKSQGPGSLYPLKEERLELSLGFSRSPTALPFFLSKFTGRTLARKPSLCSPLACGLREAARPLWTLYLSAVIWERRQQVFQAKGDISSSPNIVPDDLVFAKLSTEFHVCALQIGSAGPATSDPISHSVSQVERGGGPQKLVYEHRKCLFHDSDSVAL
ncbi:uncharacterized protein LOC116156970 [Camelus dromedarius]|uniref:uncharacterized protein LOC116156970 n=1 Tax=Camelus dromedarius TaxID=9838 RepID=UPI00311A3002